MLLQLCKETYVWGCGSAASAALTRIIIGLHFKNLITFAMRWILWSLWLNLWSDHSLTWITITHQSEEKNPKRFYFFHFFHLRTKPNSILPLYSTSTQVGVPFFAYTHTPALKTKKNSNSFRMWIAHSFKWFDIKWRNKKKQQQHQPKAAVHHIMDFVIVNTLYDWGKEMAGPLKVTHFITCWGNTFWNSLRTSWKSMFIACFKY